MYENIGALLNDIRRLAPNADYNQMQSAVKSLSRYNGGNPIKILENLYDDLLRGIPLQHTTVGKAICLGMHC